MGDFVDIASGVLSQANRRVEVAGQNIANILTPGYKRQLNFSAIMASQKPNAKEKAALDFSPGKQVNTGNPTDLSIMGDGFFVVSSSEGAFYTRAGQFHRDGDGHLVNPEGFVLQSDDGGDLTITGNKPFQVKPDGTVVVDSQPVAKIAIASINSSTAATYVKGGVLSVPSDAVASVDAPTIRQGAYEASNVSNGAEMVSIMQSLRQAEPGQKLINTYDEIMGRVIDTFSQSGGS